MVVSIIQLRLSKWERNGEREEGGEESMRMQSEEERVKLSKELGKRRRNFIKIFK